MKYKKYIGGIFLTFVLATNVVHAEMTKPDVVALQQTINSLLKIVAQLMEQLKQIQAQKQAAQVISSNPDYVPQFINDNNRIVVLGLKVACFDLRNIYVTATERTTGVSAQVKLSKEKEIDASLPDCTPGSTPLLRLPDGLTQFTSGEEIKIQLPTGIRKGVYDIRVGFGIEVYDGYSGRKVDASGFPMHLTYEVK